MNLLRMYPSMIVYGFSLDVCISGKKKNRLERIGKEGSASYEWMKWMDEIQVASLIDDGYIIRYKTRTTRY